MVSIKRFFIEKPLTFSMRFGIDFYSQINNIGLFVSYDSKFDLYTKSSELPDVEKLKPYYQSLIDKYCPGLLRW